MAELDCCALYENYDETGMMCDLPAGHEGDHEASMTVSWPQDDKQDARRDSE